MNLLKENFVVYVDYRNTHLEDDEIYDNDECFIKIYDEMKKIFELYEANPDNKKQLIPRMRKCEELQEQYPVKQGLWIIFKLYFATAFMVLLRK